MSEETKLPDGNGGKEAPSEETSAEASDRAPEGTWEPPGFVPIEPPRRHGVEIWKGIGLTALLHLIPLVFPALYFGIGIVQFLYLIPALILCRKNSGMQQGILIAAGITFLLNAACFGFVFVSIG